MKTLHLLRHAKSSWSDSELPDLKRPLKPRGKRACLLMIEPIWKAGCRFQHIYCSHAKRAVSTVKMFEKSLPPQTVSWEKDKALYTFDDDDLLHWLQQLDDEQPEVMIVGHNPALTLLANHLGDLPIDNIPTCGYVQLQADIKRWQKLAAGCASTRHFLYPKMFTDGDNIGD